MPVSDGVDSRFIKPTLVYTGVNLMYSKGHTLVYCANQHFEDSTSVQARFCIKTAISIPHPASFQLGCNGAGD